MVGKLYELQVDALTKAFAQNAYGLVLNLQGSQENKGRRREEREGREERELYIMYGIYLYCLTF